MLHILYKPGPDLYIVDLLSWHSHTEYRNQEINNMNVNVHAISTSVNIQICTSIEDIQVVTQQDACLQTLKSYVIYSWPHKKDKVEQSMKHYWPISHEQALTDGISMKGKRIIIPFILEKQILQPLQSNHLGIKKMRLLARESVYWMNMNTNIENASMCHMQWMSAKLAIREYFHMGSHTRYRKWLGLISFFFFLQKIKHFFAF